MRNVKISGNSSFLIIEQKYVEEDLESSIFVIDISWRCLIGITNSHNLVIFKFRNFQG